LKNQRLKSSEQKKLLRFKLSKLITLDLNDYKLGGQAKADKAILASIPKMEKAAMDHF